MNNMLDMHMHHMHFATMKLETYLKKNDLTDAAFGALIGISQSQISRIRRGESFPSRDTLAVIAEFTGGAVTANDFIEPITAEKFDETFSDRSAETAA